MKSLRILPYVALLLTDFLTAEVCPPSDHESMLHPWYDYTYRFQGDSWTLGTAKDRTKMSISCDVAVSHAENCFYGLRLSHCTLSTAGGPPGLETAWIADHPLPELSRYSMLFSLVNGEITEVYTDEQDAVHFVNIKRAVLSAFAFKLSYTTRAVQEMHTDVHGTCPLAATPVDTEKGTVKTVKDMRQCAFPSKENGSFSPYSLFGDGSFIVNLMNSTTDCDYDINISEKRLNEVHCIERHSVLLSSDVAAPVHSNIRYRLTYIGSDHQAERKNYSSLSRKTDIFYERGRIPQDPQSNPENFLPVAKNMLSKLVEHSVDEVSLSTVPDFTDFVAWLTSSGNLVSLVEAVKTCSYMPEALKCTSLVKEMGMSYLKDALTQCTTLPCVEATAHLTKSGDFSPGFFIYHSWNNMRFAKPAVLKHIKDICHSTGSKLCWSSLGTLVRRSFLTQQIREEDIEELRKIAKHFHDHVGQLCAKENSDSEMHMHLLKNLKAINNMGHVYMSLLPEGHQPLIECILKSDAPDYVKIFSIETLQSVGLCRGESSCEKTYKKLLLVLKNASASTALRAKAYDNILQITQKHGFEEELLAILQKNESIQLKSYIANSLKALFMGAQFKNKEENSRFVRSMKQVLNDNELSLNRIIHQPGAKSTSKVEDFSMNLPFMPEGLKSIGIKGLISKIYESSDVIPRYFSYELFMEELHKLVRIFELKGYSQGLENVAVVFQKIAKNFGGEFPSLEKLFEGVQEVMKELEFDSKPPQEYNFQETIIKNIRRLEQMYWNFKPKTKTFFSVFLDIFGTTLAYFTSGDLADLSSKLPDLQSLLEDLERGMTYNTTRVMRVFQAYHEIPTLMGLPLKWTANAYVAFSLRSGLKAVLDPEKFELRSKGFIQPSAALTFLNGMIIDFPTVTQIGAQANSSAYSSTHWKAKLKFTEKEKIFSVVKPPKSQKILELFHTNQLMKHGTYHQDKDRNGGRTSSCTNDTLSSAVGLQICLNKSYPEVAVMSGWCKWQLLMNPFDEKLESYNFEIMQPPEGDSTELFIKFSTPGSDNKREIYFMAEADEPKAYMQFQVKIPALPDFKLLYQHSNILENAPEKVCRYTLTLKLNKDHQYNLLYNEEFRAGKSSPENAEAAASVHERLFSLETPYSRYRLSKEQSEKAEDLLSIVSISYENLCPSSKWLHAIVPSSFWESDTKAWVRFQIDWKGEEIDVLSIKRQTVCRLTDPMSVTKLNAQSLEMSGQEKVTVNLTKNEVSTGKLLAFANFTYELQTNENDGLIDEEIRIFNVTVPRKSWAVQFQKLQGKGKFLYQVTLARAVMNAKYKEMSDYVGWWNEEAGDYFSIEERQIKLVVDAETKSVSTQELVSKYTDSTLQEVEGLSNQLVTVHAGCFFPFFSGKESVTFDGHFITSRGTTLFRVEGNAALESTYNNLRLTTHSVYRSDEDSTSLQHQSHFTHVQTAERKALQLVELWLLHPPNRCVEGGLKHNITSNVVDQSTIVSYTCNANGENLHTLRLKAWSNSSHWDMLNHHVNQTVEDLSPEYTYETSNLTHPLLFINVTADWAGKHKMADHRKRVLFNCRKENCQSTELLIQSLQNGKFSAKLIMPDDGNRKLSLERIISADAKNVNFKLKYSEDEADESEDLQFTGEILNEDYHVWCLQINLDTYSRIKSLFKNAYKNVLSQVTEISKDSQHPVNRILQPTLKMTLFDYARDLRKQGKDLISSSWTNIEGTLVSLQPFYEAPATLLMNIEELIWGTPFFQKSTSVLMKAISYFNLPWYVFGSVTNLFGGIFKIQEIPPSEEQVLHWEFVTDGFLSMESFKQWPSISLEGINMNPFDSGDPEDHSHYMSTGFSKIAMVFGPRHLFTFDEYLYDSVDSSSGCTFLLAHDLRKSLFTVLKGEKVIHILFPEMTVTIDNENEVFINGSRSPSELPVEAINGRVVVQRGDVVEVWSPSLRVVCSAEDHLCLLEMSAWHAGETFGLLGNADGSTSNEFTLPHGRLTSDASEFVSGFEVSGILECRNLSSGEPLPHSDESAEACSREFGDLCSLSKDIRQQFLDACKSDVEGDPDACHASTGYSVLCRYKRLPSTIGCKRKERMSKDLGRDNIGVVLMVQEHRYLTAEDANASPLKGLGRLMRSLNDKLQTKGDASISFSLISFGGRGGRHQPTLHPKDGNKWIPLKVFLEDVLKNLQFDGDEDFGALNVLKFASEALSYDAFNSKIFLILTPNDCQSGSEEAMDEMRRFLDENEITLYPLSSYPSVEKEGEVFGVRGDGLLLPSYGKRRFVDYPFGDLAKLTSETRGCIFLNRFILSSHPSLFFDVFSEEVRDRVRKGTAKCRQCSSVRIGWWRHVEDCRAANC